MPTVLPFGAWLIKQANVRKKNRGMEEPLSSYFRNDPNRDRILQMDVAAFAEYLKGWDYFYNAFDAATQAYLAYVSKQVSSQ
jgi:hypothetical protein